MLAGNRVVVATEQVGQTLAALLRRHQSDESWKQIRRFIQARHVKLNGELCLDPARRLKEGDTVELLDRPLPKPRGEESIVIRHLDVHIVVVEKPSGLSTVRHPTERDWPEARRALSPTLDDLVAKMIARGRKTRQPGAGGRARARLRVVHRLDKETSGLLVFARTVLAERGLGKQFHAHTVQRRYLAIVGGHLEPRTITSTLVRDRGDGRRGSTEFTDQGKKATTHIEIVERLPGYSLVACRLETGRTHQIRIHLAEEGHPVCGEKVYNRQPGEGAKADQSGAPRLALHAAELGFTHPVTGAALHWEMPLPPDLEAFLNKLREQR
jgi:23S rRNA pseudouridine1911/1915/1917 synthase